MIRRVSSRPRLVSDADKSFENATVETPQDDLNSDYDSDNGYGNGLNYDDGDDGYDARDGDDGPLYFHQDGMMIPAAVGVMAMTTPKFLAKSHLLHPMTSSAAAAAAVVKEISSGSSSDDDDDGLNNKSASPNSTNDLSDYLSCYDLQQALQESLDSNDTSSSTSKKTTVPLLFVIPSEDDKQPPAATSSTKRKRLSQRPSQNYLTPISSYSSFTNGTNFLHQPAVPQSSQLSYAAVTSKLLDNNGEQPIAVYRQRMARIMPLQNLPQENLVTIASYLTLQDVHTFSTCCKAIRAVVLTSQGATVDIWVKRMRQGFPSVFCRDAGDRSCLAKNQAEENKGGSTVAVSLDAQLARMRASSRNAARSTYHVPATCIEETEQDRSAKTNVSLHQVAFVDDYRLPIPGLLEDAAHNSSITNVDTMAIDNVKVNLPLLTGLLPSRYPQIIDPLTLVANPFDRFGRLRPNGQRGNAVFRSYSLEIDDDNAMVSHESNDHGATKDGHNNKGRGTGKRKQLAVPVVQMLGHVGIGDRCIRSDQPFPPNPRAISPCTCSIPRASNESCSVGSFGGLSALWRKGRVCHRGSKRKSRQGSSSSSGGGSLRNGAGNAVAAFRRSSSMPGASERGSLMSYPSSVDSALIIMPSQHSPLYCFLSSLYHPCTSFACSEHDSFQYHDLDASLNNGKGSARDGLNNYGTIKHGLMSKCKQSLCKLRASRSSCLCPFVIPTVLSDNKEGSVVVDVTPRLVAYFEVTIVKKQGREYSSESQSEQQGNRIHQPFNHDQQAHRPPLQHPLAGAHHHGHPNANNNAQHQRHECVAIGLSTTKFSPTNKMPGWDTESYGYHGDDGGIFHGQGDMLSQSSPFGPGDIVGCGLEYSTRRIFFVKNGKFLGYALGRDDNGRDGVTLGKEIVESGLFPTVGVDTDCPIFTNFGESPFKFDLKGFSSSAYSESHVAARLCRRAARR